MRLVERRQKPRHEIRARACDRADTHLARCAFAHVPDLAHRAVDEAQNLLDALLEHAPRLRQPDAAAAALEELHAECALQTLHLP